MWKVCGLTAGSGRVLFPPLGRGCGSCRAAGGRTRPCRALSVRRPGVDERPNHRSRKALADHSPSEAMRNGIGFPPSKRAEEGIALGMSARENIYITSGGAGLFTIIHSRAERSRCVQAMTRFSVRPDEPERPIDRFSGGNQQKLACPVV